MLRRPVPPVPGVPEDFHNALARALHPDVSARTPTAARLRDELRGAVPTSPPPQPVAYAPVAPPPPARKKRAVAVVAAVVAVLLVGGGVWWALSRDGGTTTATGPGSSTSAPPKVDETKAPPPYLKACATGFCVEEASCYRGTVSIGGQAATARRISDCSQEHYWEAFAGGWLSGKIPKVGPDELAASPEVVGICTKEAMTANTRPNVDTSTWQIVAIGFEDDERNYFHCLASPSEGGETTTSAFGSGG